MSRASAVVLLLGLVACAADSARPRSRSGSNLPRGASAPLPGASGSGRAPSAVSSPRPPAKEPALTLPRAPLAEVAEPLPVSVERVGRGGHWIAYFIARDDTDKNGRVSVELTPAGAMSGDALRSELVVGGRAAAPIDDLFAYDATGRYLALRRAEKRLVLDVLAGTELDLALLDFDDRDDTLPFRQHRALAFDPRGALLAYVRRRDGRSEIVLRALATGSESQVTNVPGEPWRLEWDATGEQLVVHAVADDTNKNGRLDWPSPEAKSPRLRCSGPQPRFRVGPETGDRPSTFVAPRRGGLAHPVPGFALPFGTGLVIRAPDAALVVAGASGRRQVASAECGGRVLHADPARELLLIACAGRNPARAGVELVGPGYRQELVAEVQPTAVDRWPETPKRLVPLYPGSDALLVDLERRVTHRLEPGDQVILTHEARALVRRSKTLWLLDLDAATSEPLELELPRLVDVRIQGTLAAVGPYVIDVETGTLVGSVSGRPLALTPFGEALIAEGRAASAEELARGPVRWRTPTR